MIATVAELDASIPAQSEPTRTLPDNATPPYDFGDLVGVYFQPFIGEARWVPGMIRECYLPKGARRFTCVVALGNSLNTQYMAERIYCWDDGWGDEIIPLSIEKASTVLAALNKGTDLGAIFKPHQASLFDAYPAYPYPVGVSG